MIISWQNKQCACVRYIYCSTCPPMKYVVFYIIMSVVFTKYKDSPQIRVYLANVICSWGNQNNWKNITTFAKSDAETGFWIISQSCTKQQMMIDTTKTLLSCFFYILWFFVFFPCLLFPWKALGKHTRLIFVGMRVILHFDISFPRSPQSFPEPPKKAISLKEQCMQRIPKNKMQGSWFEIQNKVHACTYVCMYKQYVTPMNRNKNTRMYMWQGLRMHATSYALPENTSKSKALFL